MLKSMTGFGRGQYEDDKFSVTVEIRSVNHRYNEVSVRVPRFLNSVEDRIRKMILKSINRGRIDVFVTANYAVGENSTLTVDKNLAVAYHKALLEISQAVGIGRTDAHSEQELLQIARFPDVINVREDLLDAEELWPKIGAAVQEATDHLVAMRLAEGENIYDDFLLRADIISERLAQIEARSPMVVEDYQSKLSERLNNLLENHKITVEPERLLQEIAILADRTSITEEIVRLRSHLKQFRIIVSSDQPVGRKLDFLIQELNREANTIASKANDYTLAQIVVEIKAEIEKIREQIQNIE